MTAVTVIIVNWNTRDLLARCLESVVEQTAGVDLETIVVDNASTDGSAALVRERFPAVNLIVNAENLGFARANNQAAPIARGDYLLLLNSDARLGPGTPQALLNVARANPRAAVVGPRILNEDGSFQGSHVRYPDFAQELLILSGLGRLLFGRWYPSGRPGEMAAGAVADWISGACMLVRRQAFLDSGSFDEGYFMYGEEMDLCYRLHQKGWEIWYQPAATVFHLGSASSKGQPELKEADLYRGRIRFFRKHYGDVSAGLLKAIIYAATAVKSVVHAGVRGLSGGRRGRKVVPLRRLVERLRNA